MTKFSDSLLNDNVNNIISYFLLSDAIEAEKLSVAMQRCYIVVKDLMKHTHAIPFLFPVDPIVYPGRSHSKVQLQLQLHGNLVIGQKE